MREDKVKEVAEKISIACNGASVEELTYAAALILTYIIRDDGKEFYNHWHQRFREMCDEILTTHYLLKNGLEK